MSPPTMTSLERVLTTLGHREPDRVPLFLLLSLHGARELGLSIREYFSRPEHVATAQLRMRARYGHDCLYAFSYAPIEVEAWGGEVVWRDDGPPNSGRPFIRHADQINDLAPPDVPSSPLLGRTLEAISQMRTACSDAPIIGVVMSPFSLPVMQMGFEAYLDLLYERRELFSRLMAINEAFCVSWANAQLKAGATAICYFDPLASSTVLPPDLYRDTGLRVAQRTLARIEGPTATHLASGRCLPVLDDIAGTGTAIIGVSAEEDLAEVKAAASGRLTILGNLNGIEMRGWTPADAERHVKAAIAAGGPGGGFVLSDNHGEIPWQVPETVLDAMGQAVREWGRYPLRGHDD
jgi:uroporphyrinogen decarboxylase